LHKREYAMRRKNACKALRKRLTGLTTTLAKVARLLATLRCVIIQAVVLVLFVSNVWDSIKSPPPLHETQEENLLVLEKAPDSATALTSRLDP
jgi:hypothetical protein